MIKKLLIANRGEIALRIIRACKELGIRTVAVYSEVDRDSLHVRFADEAVCIGPGPSAQSYLNTARIISAAEVTDADAIHPGYGFLAENPYFAEVCQQCNIKFIGPSAETMRLMGDKAEAKRTAQHAGVPVIPGSDGAVPDTTEALNIAREIGYPLMLKAVSGGGGRGMRLAENDTDLLSAFATAQAEAEKAFGRPEIYVEKIIASPKHVEIQILADELGNMVHLGERDCSIQRRHQKLIEETPCSLMTPKLREQMGQAALKLAEAVGYQSAGTVEFLLDNDGQFYFMEMNTRVQVEHPVTEQATGADLIKEQLKIAHGERLNFNQEEVKLQGHAIECRINAEDPDRDFMPCPGKITAFHIPGGPGVRVDSHVYTEYIIPPFYDSMIAKLITWGRDRHEAILRMQRALDEFVIEGVKTIIPFQRKVIQHPSFISGKFGTDFLDQLNSAFLTYHS